MQPIKATIKPGDSGPAVSALQDAMLALLAHQIIKVLAPPNRPTKEELAQLTVALNTDRAVPQPGTAIWMLVGYLQVQQGLGDNLHGVVEQKTADTINQLLKSIGVLDDEIDPALVVHGTVAGAQPGWVAQVVDVDFRSVQHLGDALIGPAGDYRVSYHAGDVQAGESGTADIRVTVVDAKGTAVVSSDIHYNVAGDVTIDLFVEPAPDGLSEFERYSDALAPVLGDVPIAEVDAEPAGQQAQDLDFLSGDTGIDRQRIAWLARGAALATGATAAIPAAAFYGWFREGLADDLAALEALPISALRSALRAAITANIAPASLGDEVESILRSMPNPQRDAVQALGTASGLPASKIPTLLQHVSTLTELTNGVTKRLVSDGVLVPAEAHTLGLSVTLHTLFDGRLDAVTAVQKAGAARVPGGALSQARDLAALDAADISAALAKGRVKPADGSTLDAMAARVARALASAYPTDWLLYRAADAKVTDLHSRNPTLDLLAIDYLPGSESLTTVDFGTLSAGDQAKVIGTLKSYQRVQRLTGDAIVSQAVVAAGYHSAVSIVRADPVQFAAATKLPTAQATATYAAARQKANEAAISFVSVHDAARDQKRFSNQVTPGVPATLAKLAGYADLFGSLDYCECEDCQSVLSPAAYFVDLMRYTEKNILGPSFANNGGAGNSLHLKARRPDLWSLPLTCANTETYVPTLDIVIRVLETFITKTIPASTLSLYERIAASDASISQPFTWPLERVTILLSYFGVTRADIARLFVLGTGPADSAKRSRCRLNLSLAEYQQIIAGRLGTPPTVATLTAAGKYYDVLIGPLSLTMIVANIETQFANTIPIAWLADGTDLPLDVLRLLVGTDFINGTATDAAHRIVIQRGIGTPGGVQNDTELVLQLTVGRVDRIERFVRLWRHLPWNVIELDYVLMRLMATLPSTVTPTPDRRLDPPMVDGVAQLLDIQARWSLPVDELCALWDAMPAVGLRNDVSLFDRAFNQSVFVKATADLFPQPATRFAFPELAGVAGTTSPHARLLAALQISDADLSALFAGLDPTNAGLLLTADNLALMYRHARLAVLMGLSIADLFQSITLLGTVGSAVTTLAGLGQLLAFHDWRAASGFGLDEMAFIVGSSPSLGTMASPDDLVASIVAAIQGDEPLEMSDTVFTAIGLTEEQSRGVVAANLSQNATDGLPLERTPGSTTYRLRVPWDPDDPGSPLVFAPVASTAMVAAAARAAYDLASAAGPAGFATDLFTALGMTTARSTAVVNANIHVGTDAKPFVAVGTTGRYRVRADVTPDAALQQMLGDATSSAVLQAAATDGLVAQARALLARHHPFRVIVTHAAASLLTDGDRVRAMLALVMPATSALVLQYITAACEALQGGSQAPLVAMLAALGRLAALFKSSVFDPATLGFASAARAVFALPASPTNLTTPLVLGSDSVRRVAMYVALANAPDPAFDPAAAPADVVALQAILQSGAALSAADPAALAGALRADSPRVGALVQQLQAQLAGGLDGLTQLANALALAGKLGASAATLQLTVSDAFADLTRAADGIYGVFRATYPDEDTFDAKIEPFNDQLRGRQRDGLVEFLIHPPLDATGLPGLFADADDLYDYFLIDVQVGGCARTSEIVSAISTVQLYVQRVIMHLEQSDDGTVIASLVDPPLDEWTWRKNYRLWEANRRIFLFPESYIEPGLRDDKTPLFQDLESTLLQTPVADQDVLDAYAEYLHGFDEIARLRIAGVYHDRPTGGDDALYLFGVTPNEPPVYYYRVIRNVESTKPTTFGPWQKVNLQVPARKVSPIVYGGRLYVFWVETSTRAITSFKNGASVFTGYRHTTRTRVSQLRLDGQWTPPQTLKVVDDSGAPADARLTDDALIKALEALEDSNDVVFWGPYDPNHLTPAQRDNFNALMGVNTVAKTTVFSPEFWYRAEWDIRNRISQEPLENYAPEGWLWERPYPSPGAASLRLPSFPDAPWNTGAPSTLMVDFWAAMIRADTDPSTILTTTDAIGVEPVTTGGQNLRMTYTTKAQPVTLPFYYATRQLNDLTLFTGSGLISASNPLIRVPDATELQVVNGNETNVVIDALGDLLLFRSEPASGKPELWRLGTTLAGLLGEKLSTDGIPGLLKTWWQDNALVESGLTVAVLDTTIDAATRVPTDPLTDAGAVVGYYREVFFQIPFLIADYLNSQQNFEGALKWYNYIFDPTARDDPPTSERVRPWRYHEFRTIAATTGYETFRAMLTNQAELDAYKNDPFNPHAIARLRPGAYQKAVVMKYIDNLIDWGDTLFTQFTMESLNEATMLYVMASEILGRRPAEVGPCGDTTAPPATYQLIAPKLDDGTKSDFLLEEFELLSLPDGGQIDDTYVPVLATAGNPQGSTFTVRSLVAGGGGGGAAGDGGAGVGNGTAPPGYGTGLANPTGWNTPGASVWATTGGTPLSTVYGGGTVDGTLPLTITGTGTPSVSVTGDPLEPPVTVPSIGGFTGTINDVHSAGSMGKLDIGYGSEPPIGQGPPQQGFTPPAQAWDLVASRLVFCFPQNQDFLAYWDRVEDRLNKIRNCMDISGVRRQPDLFAPEIDPRLLVRMRAAGLSLDDVLNATSGMVPPYRFQFLIDKAKQHAGLVQSFGGQLLSALEKRNGEELQQLRAVHEQNLLKLRQKAMQLEIDAAEDTLESLQRQQTAVTFRRDHYANLLQTGLSGFERVQQIGTHIASGMHEIEALVQIVSGALHLVPQLGAPTAIVYGGVQLGETAARFGYASQALAEASAAAATSAGIEATFQRRSEEWKLQMDMANQELSQLEKQITAAGIRRDIATEAQTAHNRSIDQSEEIFDLLRDKFSSFGLYTYLSTELQRLNRLAFNAALSVANMAERAYRFERPDEDAAPLLTNDYWDAGNAGLLGGDKLVLDLQQLERRYIETNYRMLEVEQSFSLSQIAPSALLALRENGSCTFTVPEWALDITYPGHYRRRIKAVRLSIPCVTGPYLNVGATLQLTGSRVRQRTDSNAPLVDVPLGSTSAIATSSAQNDAGTFEFSFRDERFMPFESAGAISDWQLDLPAAFRSFDYRTISDVVLRVSYMADQDAGLRARVENVTAPSVAGSLRKQLEVGGMPLLYSLRNDFPDAWRMLVTSAPGTIVPIDLGERQLPALMAGWLRGAPTGRSLSLAPASLAFVTQSSVAGVKPSPTLAAGLGTTTAPTALVIDATAGADGMYHAALSGTAALTATAPTTTLRLRVDAAGNLAPAAGVTGITLDESKVRDVMLLATVRLSP